MNVIAQIIWFRGLSHQRRQLRRRLQAALRDILRESFTLIVFLSASFYYSWRLTLGSLLIAPVIGVLTARFGRALRNLARESHEGSQRMVDTAQEALSNQNVVKAYRAEQREQQRFRARRRWLTAL
ncbi:MAG: ABC transporter transmembrane domain-containing protein [Pyrinomonadaceae bacterium]